MLLFFSVSLIIASDSMRSILQDTAVQALVVCSNLGAWIYHILAVIACIHALSAIVPMISVWLSSETNLKAKYDAKWAVVTGGSSGIGRAIVDKVANQGLNVVIVALEDNLLQSTVNELREKYPSQKFRSVAVNFSTESDYLSKVVEGTKDIPVQLLFNNAGYIQTGFFSDTCLEKQIMNVECNATASVRLTHHFVERMLNEELKGCVVFTSSASAYLPSPFAVMYGATKAFLSQFAASLAIESRANGIDVLAVHASPVRTRIYDKTHALESLDFALKFAISAEGLASEVLRSIGKVYWRDIGGFALVSRAIMSTMTYNMFITLMAAFAHHLPDYKNYSKDRKKKKI